MAMIAIATAEMSAVVDRSANDGASIGLNFQQELPGAAAKRK